MLQLTKCSEKWESERHNKLFKLNGKYINKYDFKLLGIKRINKVDREATMI